VPDHVHSLGFIMPRQLEKMDDTRKQLLETKLSRSSHIKKSLRKKNSGELFKRFMDNK